MRIAFAGSHGVGKSTLARWLAKEMEYTLIPDLARELRIIGLYPEDDKKIEHRMYILWKQIRLEANKYGSFVADGALYSQPVYATAHNEGLYTEELERISLQYGRYDFIFYLPIELQLERDAMRTDDVQYQEEVDELYRDFLSANHIPFVEISGTLLERKSKIKTIIIQSNKLT